MSELNFLLRKVAADKEKDLKKWRTTQLEVSIIPHTSHELQTLKELGLDYISTMSRLNTLHSEYRELTGHNYVPKSH